MKTLATPHGKLTLPAFMPDATRGAVRTLDSDDLQACGIDALMVNTLHLSSTPGVSLVKAAGGIHTFMGWEGPIASDSGGFQALSFVIGNKPLGAVSDDGFTYRLDRGGAKKLLTPEKCIQRQANLGADIMFCLDHCTHPGMPASEQRESVTRTIAWAQRCKDEFEKRIDNLPAKSRPRLFAVVQGGNDPDLRRECIESLTVTGFDGYGFGGWPIDDTGNLTGMVQLVAESLPNDTLLHGLGIGKPHNVVQAAQLGYTLFDCVMPTRDARHGRLFAFRPGAKLSTRGDFYDNVNIMNESYARQHGPVEEACDCLCCRRYSAAYLHHLFAVKEQSAYRLATIHNLRFYARLVGRLRAETLDL